MPKSAPVPRLVVDQLDEATWDRLHAAALAQGCSPGDIAARALRFAFGLSSEDFSPRDRQDIATLRGVWNQSENAAFRDAFEAFKDVDSGPTFEPAPKKR